MPEITITAKRDGFRRCGVAHRDVPVTWPDGSFTDEQIAILRAEPSLVVHLGPVSGDDDKLKAALGRVQELEKVVLQLKEDSVGLMDQLVEMTADRDRLQEALTAAGSPSDTEAKEIAADDTAAADSSAKAKK
ncbi:HI1506-related protein [Klebsiella pneumoniae]|uniref:HI1506-related protein n=1 Tax=Klebsiella pneumoniae TaxID=573 RepID=UPI003F64084B